MNRRQRGYTLVELMISLLLGLMLISGFGSLFVQTQKSAAIQRSLSYMTEDGRYMLELLGRELRHTGSLRSKADTSGSANIVFTADPNVLGSTISFPDPTVDPPAEYVRGEFDAAGFGAAADQPYNINRLALRYQLNDSSELAVAEPSSDNSPCTRDIHLVGGDNPAAVAPLEQHVVTLYFYVAFDASINAPVLYCKAKREKFIDHILTTTTTSGAMPLISNLQKLVITYGIDTDADGDGIGDDGAANYYVDADNVPNWRQVVSAKLSVVLRSEDDNLTQSPVTYTVDGDPNSPYTATDNRLYRVFSTTIAFRN